MCILFTFLIKSNPSQQWVCNPTYLSFLVQGLALALARALAHGWALALTLVLELVFYPSNRHTCFYLHIFFFDPITVLLEKLRQLGVRALEENHQNIEAPKETKWWLTRPDDLGECAMSRKFRLFTHIRIAMHTKFAVWPNGDNDPSFHFIVYKDL